MKMVPELSDLFAVDRLFQRSLSLFCPIDVYGDLLHSGYFSVADLCMSLRRMLSQRFQRMPTDDLVSRHFRTEMVLISKALI